MIDVWSYGLVFGITLGSYCYNRIYAQLQTTNSSCTPPSPLEHVRTAHSTRLVPACNGHTQAQLACQLLTASMHMRSRPSIDRSRSRMHRRTVRASRCAIIFRSQGEIDVYVHALSHVCVCNRLDNWVVHYSFEALYWCTRGQCLSLGIRVSETGPQGQCWELIYWWSTLVTAGDGYLPKGLHILSPCPFIMYIYVQTNRSMENTEISPLSFVSHLCLLFYIRVLLF